MGGKIYLLNHVIIDSHALSTFPKSKSNSLFETSDKITIALPTYRQQHHGRFAYDPQSPFHTQLPILK